MRILILAFFLFFYCKESSCQTLQAITVDQLNKRISNGSDTTFVISFWATWCSPCKKELPYFMQLENEYAKDKLKVLLISVDFRSVISSSVIPYLKKIKKANDLFWLDEKSEQEYIGRVDKNWSGAIPATLFIKAKRRVFFEKEFTYLELVSEYKKIQ
jgi:thiol-disulfide isomerase/thioredoxin